jgi:hypothetical protein
MERDTVRGPTGADSLGADGKPIEEVHARHILVKVTPNDADIDRTQDLANKVRDQAAKGGDFGALAKKYSTYRGNAQPDGDVGFLSLGSLQPNIRAGVENLKPGEVSQVLPNQQGFNIFKLLEKKARKRLRGRRDQGRAAGRGGRRPVPREVRCVAQDASEQGADRVPQPVAGVAAARRRDDRIRARDHALRRAPRARRRVVAYG